MFRQLEESENQTIIASLSLSELLLLIVSKISTMLMSVQNVGCSISKKLETSKPFFSLDVLRLSSIFNFSRYFTFLTECETPKACTILLRGPSKDILNEIDRNLADAMSVARNVVFNPILAPGGGATEMAISVGLHAKAKSIVGVEGWPYRAVADAMEVIPRTLVQNSGGNAMRVLTELRVRFFLYHCVNI
jgi:chaperonin GroEL (HSP60 family)